jgi:hypothetical protein
VAVGCVAVASLIACGAPARAALVHPYLSQITGSGKVGKTLPSFGALCGVNVDPASGEVYVANPSGSFEAPAIDVFGPSSSLIGKIDKGPEGSELEGACSTAVNDTTHEVYVAESEADLVYVYDEDSGKFKLQRRATINGADTPEGSFLAPNNDGVYSQTGDKILVAVAQPTEDVYVSAAEQGVVDQFNSKEEYRGQLSLPSGGEPTALATDSSGDVYVAVKEGLGGEELIDEFGPSGDSIRQISGPSGNFFGDITGLAVDAEGHLYASDGEKLVVDEFDSAGDFMGQMTGSGSPSGTFAAPEGVAVNAQGDVYVADPTLTREQSSPGVVDVFGPAMREAPPFLEGEGVSEVTPSSATLHARIDPTDVETTYHFEYAPERGSSTTSPEVNAGSGESVQEVSLPLQDLLANTTYHYHVIVVADGAHGPQTEEGPSRAFTTLPGASAAVLPDGRAWELVSPVDKHGALIEGIGAAGIEQAAATGDAISYSASSSIDPNAESNAGETAVLSTRGAEGWSTRAITPPDFAPTTAAALAASQGLENRLFSTDLSLALVQPFEAEPPLSPEASSERTPYLRDENDVPCEISETTCYTPLVTGNGEYADVPPGTKFDAEPQNIFGSVRVVSATPDLSHVVLQSPVALTEDHASGALYEWTRQAPPAQRLQLISVLPDGEAAEDPTLGYELSERNNVRNAISSTGSRIVWMTTAVGSRHLYLRDALKRETLELDTPEAGLESHATANPVFQTASTDGSIVFFSDEQVLTSDSTAAPGKPDLYACLIKEGEDRKLSCQLDDLTSKAFVKNPDESAAVQGAVLGASEDGASLYFVADGVLSNVENAQGDRATPGGCGKAPPFEATCNIYREHYNGESWEEPTFIAALSSTDGPDWNAEPGATALEKMTARVSPDGGYVAFMSDRSLTGYDNTDASSGVADEEVFLYGGAPARLICASCNPSGARPQGVFDGGGLARRKDELVVDRQKNWQGRWLAGNVPGWTGLTESIALYQSRYLSNSGRLFFDAADALVPQDTNGKEDVYEYEPRGVGNCAGSSETFNGKVEGCASLVSSGTSSEESAFLDASETGGDVFFITTEKLTSQDIDHSFDVYDAHACDESGESPCLAPPSTPPPACGTPTACKAPTPVAPLFQAPSSSTFSGAGNAPQQAVLGTKATKPAVKKPTRAQELAKALRVCRKKKNKSKRVACEKQARKKYGPENTKKKAKAKRRSSHGARR